mgnify:FL=1
MSLLKQAAEKARTRFHPLHRLRKNLLYQRILQPCLDIPIPANLGLRHPVYLRILTHFSFLFLSQKMEENLLQTCKIILGHLHVEEHSFIDVGANIGLYTWSALDTKPDLHVAAFEPDPRNTALLKRTQKRWGAPNLKMHFSAVSNNHGQASFSQDVLSSATGSLDQSEPSFSEHHYRQRKSLIEVPTVTLDCVTKTLPPPALVKIDVEGHEQEVLEGAQKTLMGPRPILLIESFGEKVAAIRQILEPLGYHFQDADHSGNTTVKTMNYLCLAPEKTECKLLSALSKKGYLFNS